MLAPYFFDLAYLFLCRSLHFAHLVARFFSPKECGHCRKFLHPLHHLIAIWPVSTEVLSSLGGAYSHTFTSHELQRPLFWRGIVKRCRRYVIDVVDEEAAPDFEDGADESLSLPSPLHGDAALVGEVFLPKRHRFPHMTQFRWVVARSLGVEVHVSEPLLLWVGRCSG